MRTDEEMEAARLMLRPFDRAGYRLFPLAKGGKTPRDAGWQNREYLFAEIGRWLRRGGNAGIVLQESDVVVDVDPRNGGLSSYRRLCRDLDIDLSVYPAVLSGRGDGGRHIYMTKPSRLKTRGKLAAYPGLDFLSKGKYLVAPGSIHPETGQPYLTDESAPQISEIATAPGQLLKLLVRGEAIIPASSAGEFGIISNEQLAEMLAVLDPCDYGKGKHDEWLRLACACYDATAGSGIEAFLDWCAGDPDYSDETHQEMNRQRWLTMAWKRPGDTTFRTLFGAVSAAGRPDLVAVADASDDFPMLSFPAYEDSDFGSLPAFEDSDFNDEGTRHE